MKVWWVQECASATSSWDGCGSDSCGQTIGRRAGQGPSHLKAMPDARLVGAIGRILGGGARLRAHHIVPQVCSPMLRPSSTGGRRPWNTASVLSAVGFDTVFDKSLMMESGWQASLKALHEAQSQGTVTMPTNEFGDLEAQALTGECTLQIGATGELERVVPVEVLELARADGCILTKVGMWKSGAGVTPDLSLPGKKRGNMESAQTLLRLVIRRDLQALGLAAGIQFTVVRVEETVRASTSCGLSTRYIRTIHGARLAEGFRPAPCASLTVHGLDALEYLVMPLGRAGDRVDLFAWLPPNEIKRLGSPEGKEPLRRWMCRFDSELELLMLTPTAGGYRLLTHGQGARRMAFNGVPEGLELSG